VAYGALNIAMEYCSARVPQAPPIRVISISDRDEEE
jgi:hypothetical protein